jgi:FkbM family methyltransferase
MTTSSAAPASDAAGLIEPIEAQGVQHIPMGFNTLSKCRYGWMLYHTRDSYIGRSLRKYGEFSEGEVAMFRQLLSPGDIVVEAGANFGAHTVAMAQMVGSHGAVFAFEPQRLVHQVLNANVALNSLTNVTTMHAGLGAQLGRLRVPALDPALAHNFGSLSIGASQDGEPVSLATIDGLDLPSCRLIKADVEGMEWEVLAGAHDTIARLKPILYVENDRTEHSPRLITLIRSMGYRLWWHLPLLYNPENFRNDQENVFGNTVSVNMLCLPQEVAVTINLPEVQTPHDDWRIAATRMAGRR